MLALDSQGEVFGGSEASARKHFDRAVQLKQGQAAGPYLSLAEGISRPKDDRAEYEKLLKAALAIDPNKDPSLRLLNLITQKRAKALMARINEFFPK